MKRKTILKYISLLIVTALFRRTTSKKEPILINYYPKNTTPVNFKLQEIVDNTLNTQANDIFNVLDYIPQNFHKGIKDGTNTTFLTSYIQAAIDAVHKSGGGTLFFPAGTYKVFTLKLSSYLTLDGHQATITSDASDTNPCLGVIQSEGWGSTATTYDAAVKNLTIDGGNANYAIFIHRSERVNVENCRINNVKKGGIRFNYETSNCTAVNNYIELPVDRPFGTVPEAQGIFCVSLVDPYGEGKNNTLTFIQPKELSQRHIISGNKIFNGTHSIALFGASSCQVLNNYLYGASHRGVILSPVSHNNTIQNNLIENFGSTGIHLAWGSGENIITGNTLRTSVSIIEGNGIKCYYGCANNNIVGNCVSGTLYAAYRLAVGCYDNQIINNKAFNCGMGIVIETLIHKNSGYYNSSYYQPSHAPPVERSVVKGNYLFKCKDGIVLAQRGNSYLRNNEIIDNQFWQCQHNFKYSEEKKGKLYGVKFENNINKVLDTKGC